MPTIQDLVAAAADREGVPRELALSLARQESGFNPRAVSWAGAIGVMQLMPATAAGLGVDPYDPVQNIDGGVRYLRGLLDQFGDYAMAIAAYNWGPSKVEGATARYGSAWLSHAPAETRNHVAKVLGRIGEFATVVNLPTAEPPADPVFTAEVVSTPLAPNWFWILLALAGVALVTD